MALSDNAIVRSYSTISILQRKADGYFGATALCKAGTAETGKRKDFHNYKVATPTQEFLKELSSTTGLTVDQLIQSLPGSPENGGGSWVHPRVAMHLAQWCSPKFAVRVTEWVLETLANPPAQAKSTQPEVRLPDLTTPEGALFVFEAFAATARIQIEQGKKIDAVVASVVEIQAKVESIESQAIPAAEFEALQTRLQKAEEGLDTIVQERKTALAELNKIPLSTRKPRPKKKIVLVRELVNHWAEIMGMSHKQVWTQFHEEFKKRYQFDALGRRQKMRGMSGIQIIERFGLIDDAYDLASEMFNPNKQVVYLSEVIDQQMAAHDAAGLQ